MEFFKNFLDVPVSELKYSDVKEIGIDFDWFSNIYGITILVGKMKYKSFKNYRCKEEFRKNVLSKPLDIPTVIFIHNWENEYDIDKSLKRFKKVDNLFVGQYLNEISKIKNRMIFQIKPPKLKKNGKPEKQFKIQRKKRFRIDVINGQCSDNTVIKSTVISCSFPDCGE
jgi:hypothetical protein